MTYQGNQEEQAIVKKKVNKIKKRSQTNRLALSSDVFARHNSEDYPTIRDA